MTNFYGLFPRAEEQILLVQNFKNQQKKKKKEERRKQAAITPCVSWEKQTLSEQAQSSCLTEARTAAAYKRSQEKRLGDLMFAGKLN